jgi:hypothetical protein
MIFIGYNQIANREPSEPRPSPPPTVTTDPTDEPSDEPYDIEPEFPPPPPPSNERIEVLRSEIRTVQGDAHSWVILRIRNNDDRVLNFTIDGTLRNEIVCRSQVDLIDIESIMELVLRCESVLASDANLSFQIQIYE